MVLKYPGATWDPLGTQTEPLMAAHDIVCLHTMVGTLAGTSSMFHQNGYSGTESHFGVGENKTQGARQWQDLMHTADANLDGNDRVISIETADWGGVFGTWDDSGKSGDVVPAWTNDQLDMIVALVVWLCRKENHASCPSTWKCHQYGIPCVLIPDTKQGRRGIGYHKQGIDPWRCATCERWSNSTGKVCPGAKRINQLVTVVIPRAQKILAGSTTPDQPPTPEEDMPLTEAEWSRLGSLVYQKNSEYAVNFWVEPTGTGTALRKDVAAIKASIDPAALAAAIVAKLPVGAIDQAAIEAGVRAVLKEGTDG